MRVLLLLCALLPLTAVEIAATVVRIADGDTLTVQAVPGLPPDAKRGKGGDVYIRLLCVDTLEIWDAKAPKAPEGEQARDLLARLAPPKSAITLWDAGDTLSTDRYGRVLAFVQVDKVSIQERLIAAGLSAYWRKWRDAPPPLHDALMQAEAGARADVLGAWKTQPELMTRKAAERPK